MSLDQAGIEKLVKEWENSTKALREELLRLCWFMRGGLTFTESFDLSQEDRLIISKIIESNLTTTKETQLPFF